MMRSRSMALWALGIVVALGLTPALAASNAVVSVPASVVTDGLTVDQERARQLELSATLRATEPPASLIKQVIVPVTAEEMMAIDQVDRSESPLRIGFVKAMAPPVTVLGIDRAQMAQATDGLVTWAAAITVERGGAIRLHVEGMGLPAGAELYVYSRAGEAFGPYVGTGVDDTGDFWTTALLGTEAILQLRAPVEAAAELRGVSLRITEVGVISPVFVAPMPEAVLAFCGNPDCIVDASCFSGANSIRDAYAKMEWVAGAFLYTCTGGVLNDTNPSSANYFLTANHCLSKNAQAKNVTFYWRFRTSTCNGSCPSNNGWPYRTTGSSVAATNRRGDFTLLQLNANPPAGTVRLGFTNAPVANSNGAALHRVSNPNYGPQVYSEQTVDTSAPQCQGWPRGERIYSRTTLGGTDGGSSGSPVVNASDQVVGQLSGSCGFNTGDPCDHVDNATVDGALAYYWSSVQQFIAP